MIIYCKCSYGKAYLAISFIYGSNAQGNAQNLKPTYQLILQTLFKLLWYVKAILMYTCLYLEYQ